MVTLQEGGIKEETRFEVIVPPSRFSFAKEENHSLLLSSGLPRALNKCNGDGPLPNKNKVGKNL